MANQESRVESVFFAAIEKQSPEELAAYLDAACEHDKDLRMRVEALLNARPKVGSFLQGQAADFVTTLVPPHPEHPEQSGKWIGPFKLLQEIGHGGMGVVYLAEQKEPVKRKVALKIIKPGMDTRQVIARFEAERQALAMMEHPNIAKVLDAGTTDSGQPYFVMELVNGMPLTQFCDEQHLTARERLALFIPVCQAVQHAHQKGIIHRDLKPSNILVALYDGRPVPKVIDFGVAKATGGGLTEKTMFTALGQIIGTIEYMSPEQAQRNQLDIDTRSDVYSLGVVLYELLTGDTPFDRQRLRRAAIDELLRIIREEEPPRPSTRLSGSTTLPAVAANRRIEPAKLSALIRGELDWIVMKALEKDRARRYETASDFARDIERYLQQEPVLACPPTWNYRLSKTFRKHRGVIFAAATLLLTLIGGLTTTFWQYTQANQQRQLAEIAGAEAMRAQRVAESRSTTLAQSITELTRARSIAEDALADRSQALQRSEATRLAAQAGAAIPTDPGLALLLAIESAKRMPESAAANNALLASLNSCREIQTFSHRPDAQVLDVVFSPDQKTVLGVEAVRIGIWEANTGRLLHLLDPQYRIQNMEARFSPDNRHFAVISRGGVACRTPDGTKLGYSDRVIRIFDSLTGNEVLVLRGHSDRVVDLCYSRDGRRIVSASWDGTVRLWDAQNGELLRTFEFGMSIALVRMSADERTVIAVRESQSFCSILAWSNEPEESHPKVLDPPLNASFGENAIVGAGQHNVSQTADSFPLVKAWSVENGDLTATLQHQRIQSAEQMEVLSDADSIHDQVLLKSGSHVTLWNIKQGTMLAECDTVSWNLTSDLPWEEMNLQFQGDRKQLQELSVDPRRVAEYLSGCRISSDGKLAASAIGNTIVVRTIESPTTSVLLKGHHGEKAIESMTFSRDGRRLLSAGDNTIRLWDTSELRSNSHRASVEMRQPVTSPIHIYSPISSLAFSPNGKLLATTSRDKFARLFDAETGVQRAALLGNAELDHRSTQSLDLVKSIRDMLTKGNPEDQPCELRMNSLGEAQLVRFSRDGSRIVVLSDDPRTFVTSAADSSPLEPLPFTPARIWDVATHDLVWVCPGNVFELSPAERGHRAGSLAWGFKSASFTSDGKWLVTSDDQSDRYAVLDENGSNRESGVRSGITISAPGDEGRLEAPFFALRCWDATTGSQIHALTSTVAGKQCYLSDSGRRGLVPELDGYQVVDPVTGKAICRLQGEVNIGDIPATFSPDDQWLVVIANGLHVWNAATGEYQCKLGPGEERSAGTESVRDAGMNESRRGDEAQDADPRREYHLTSPNLVQFTPDSTLLVTGSTDGSAHVWEVATGRHVAGFFGHTGKITCLDLSHDGKWCVTGSADGTAQVWNTHSGVERMTLPIGSEVTAIAFDEGGDRIAAAAGGVVHTWPVELLPLALSRAPRELTFQERSRFAE